MRWGAAATLWGMITPSVRAALPPLAVAIVLVGTTAWLWPDSGSPTVDQAITQCRQQVADQLNDPSVTFGDVGSRRNGDSIEVAGKVIAYTPLARHDWTCRAHGTYPGNVQVDDVHVE